MSIIRVEREEKKGVDELLRAIERVEAEEGVHIIALDERAVFGGDQVRAAIMHAQRNFAEGKNVARDFRTEVMRYISCERQIKEAIKKAGVKEGSGGLILAVTGGADEERILKLLGLKKSGFISEKRDKVDEALESMALLDL